ncbi:hypothetical protein [Streptomyces alkaliphilus]|uniref:hypothetical protein n=1 Tax=Streptomyces alkaliphilus TaxID=1472722 RepID=UPI00117C5797|nr:hypothetical protein [Streptomyces alkaliphilus]MQS08387.1 hypothetical protein [Streptomyces alkaliphilus]
MHDAGVLGLADRPGRDHWWAQLGPAVRERIAARVGPTVEWWADCHSVHVRRPHAVVLGERGLALCTPTVNDRGGPAQALTVLPFVPASLRHAVVVTRPRRRRVGRPALPGDAPSAETSADLPLSGRMRGFLGNLPAEAQARAQWPFANGDVLDRSDFHYSGTQDTLDVWCYLAGRRWVTFVSGNGSGLSGPAHRASWQLVCRRAEVARR